MIASVVLVAFASGCGSTPTPRSTATNTPTEPKLPIGDEYVLVPGPSDDDTILGRIIVSAPQAGEPIAKLIQPNPCADKLEPAKTFAMTAAYEDAEELAVGAKASATLGLFGFGADVSHATHFLYKLAPQKKVVRADTTEYAACCAEKGGNACGYGYVQSIVYGDGEYATGEETNASAGVDIVSVGSTSGAVALKVLHRKKVHGYFAIGVHPRDPSKKDDVGPLGVAKAAGISETSASDQVKAIYESQKMKVGVSPYGGYAFSDAQGFVSENEFVRRYRAATGEKDLDDVETHRAKFQLYGGITMLVVGAGLTTASLAFGNLKGNDPPTIAAFTGGFTLLVAGVPLTIFGLVFGEGAPNDHLLTEYDARIYAEKHNRKLLRKSIHDVESTRKTTWLKPKVDGGPLAGGGYLSLSFAF